MALQAFIDQYGYLAIFLGTLLEGETILVLGGVAVKLGYLSLPGVIAAAFAGSLLGDQLFFFIGRYPGRKWLEGRPRLARRMMQAHAHLERHQTLFLLGFRFLYGLRMVTPLAVGMSPIGTLRFLVLNLAGALIWAIAWALMGWLIGHGVEALLGDLKRIELELLASVAAAGFAFWLLHLWKRRKSPGS